MSEELLALREFGLSEKEAIVYLTLLREGPSTVTPLISKTQLQRGSLYDILERLIEKGVVSYVIAANRKNFQAVDPKRLLALIEEKHQRMEEALPSLLTLQKKGETTVVVLKGKKAIKSLYLEILKDKSNKRVMGVKGGLKDALGDVFYAQFQEIRRKETKDKVLLICSEKLRGSVFLAEIPNSEAKFISDELDTPSHTLIYGNRVVIHIFEETPIAIVIESEQVVKSFTNLFNNLWRTGKK